VPDHGFEDDRPGIPSEPERNRRIASDRKIEKPSEVVER
jgi:hypothetical protein